MWQIAGQDRIVALLQGAMAKGTLAHAYLLVGPPHVGKMTLAINLAQALNCTAEVRPCGECATCRKVAAAGHSDVQVIGLTRNENATEGKLIGIDQVKDMLRDASLPPFEGRCKVFIIDGAELLSADAANCLLKTLEEPEAKVVFLLLTVNDKLLPSTVVSRCQRLELRPMAVTEMETALTGNWRIASSKAGLLARLSHGCLGWAVTAAAEDKPLAQREEGLNHLLAMMAAGYDERFAAAARLAAQFSQGRQSVHGLLDLWLDFWRDLLLVKAGGTDLVTNIDWHDKLVEMAAGYSPRQIRDFIRSLQSAGEQLRQNANPRLVLEVLMLDMPQREGAGESRPAARGVLPYG